MTNTRVGHEYIRSSPLLLLHSWSLEFSLSDFTQVLYHSTNRSKIIDEKR